MLSELSRKTKPVRIPLYDETIYILNAEREAHVKSGEEIAKSAETRTAILQMARARSPWGEPNRKQ